MKLTAPENTADIEMIKDLLIATRIGATISYAALSQAIGRDVRDRWWLLTRARREAEEATGGLFETVHGQGIRRLPSADIPNAGLTVLRRIRRAAKRGAERLAGVRVNDLSEKDRQRVLAHRSQLGAISLVADGRKTSTITAKQDSNTALPAGRVLALLGQKHSDTGSDT